jgi:hypothetical protein
VTSALCCPSPQSSYSAGTPVGVGGNTLMVLRGLYVA